MSFRPKPRDETMFTEKHSWHPSGDCVCRERTIHTGRFQGGSETCDYCGCLIDRKKWVEIPRRRL